MRVGIIFVTIAYSLAVLFVAGLVMTLQGDCAAGTSALEASTCARKAVFLGLSVIVSGAVVYGAAWRWVRKRW